MAPAMNPAPFNPGARFEILRKLGQGAMGVVYEVFDRERRETVALKLLEHADGLRLARFKREFHALHDIAHPNLVSLGELFERDSMAFFTMELVRGVDLITYVRDPARSDGAAPCDAPAPGTGFDEARLRAGFRQLAQALAALHAAGHLHRDVKPSNTLVTADGRLVLLDLGLVANATATASASASASTDSVDVGTVNYMAPEQAAGTVVGPSADWYAFGTMLFEALTGQLPFHGQTLFQILLDKQQAAAPRPRELVPQVPPYLDELCAALLAAAPKARPQPDDVLARLGAEVARARAQAGTGSEAPSPASSFVGRTAELDTLREAYRSAATRATIYLVEGESGIGKTQLVEAFLRHVAGDDPDAVVLAGRCYEREAVSYKAFDGIASALASYLLHLPPLEAARVLPLEPGRVGRLFPVLKRVPAIAAAPGERSLLDPLQQRLRMFTALRELFLRLAERRRLVWFIDDLQWVDADSIVLLQELLAHEDELPVFVIATARPGASQAWATLQARLPDLAPTHVVRLDNLQPAEARALAALLLPGQPPQLCASLAAEAAGHPLLLHELARQAEAAEGSVATTLDDMLAARLAQLAPPAREVLDVVALAGGPLAQEVAAVAAGLSEADLARTTRLLQAAHLVRTDGVRRGDHVVTYHDRVREHVTGRMSPERRQLVHGRLALALERTGTADRDPRALVHHAQAAGLDELAATHAQRAARQASAALAFDEAAEFLAIALALARHDADPARALRIELAEALVNAGRGPEAAATFLEAAASAEPALRLDCQRKAAEQWILTGHIERGLDAMRDSLADIGESLAPTPRRALAQVLWNRALLRARGMRYTVRRESQIAEETLRRIEVIRAVALGLSVVDNIRAAAFNGRFLRLALQLGEPTRLVQALCAETSFLASQGAGPRARRLLAEVDRLAETHPDEHFIHTWRHGADGIVCYFESRFEAADQALARSEDASRLTPRATTFQRNSVRTFRLFALRQLGTLGRSRALCAESMRSAQQRGDRYIEASILLMCNLEHLALDDTATARRCIDEVRWAPPEIGFHVQHWYALRARAELALYEGRAGEVLATLFPEFTAMRRAMLLRVRIVRCLVNHLRGRLLLGALAEGRAPAGAGAEVAHLADRLEHDGLGCGAVFGSLLRAGLAALERGATHPDVVAALRRAIDRAKDQQMLLNLAAARAGLAQIVGGDEGTRLRADAEAFVATEAIHATGPMFTVILPGVFRP